MNTHILFKKAEQKAFLPLSSINMNLMLQTCNKKCVCTVKHIKIYQDHVNKSSDNRCINKHGIMAFNFHLAAISKAVPVGKLSHIRSLY